MANYTDKITYYCYIGTTKNSVGIFLSEEIVQRNEYAKHMRLESFPSFQDAYNTLITWYPQLKDLDPFELNCLHRFREASPYAVHWTSDHLIILSEDDSELLERLPRAQYQFIQSRGGFSYDEAQHFAQTCFAIMYNNPDYHIAHQIPLNTPVSLNGIIKANKKYFSGSNLK